MGTVIYRTKNSHPTLSTVNIGMSMFRRGMKLLNMSIIMLSIQIVN